MSWWVWSAVGVVVLALGAGVCLAETIAGVFRPSAWRVLCAVLAVGMLVGLWLLVTAMVEHSADENQACVDRGGIPADGRCLTRGGSR